MTLYIVGDCPICPGSAELIALQDKKSKNLFFYCPACEAAWDHIPHEVNEIKNLASFAPSGVLAASAEDLLSIGLDRFEITNMYQIVNGKLE